MLEIIFSSNFFNAAHSLVEEIVKISTIFFTLGMIVYFLSSVFRMTADREGDQSLYHVLFVVFAIIGLATYRIWAVWIGKLFVLLSRSIFDLDADGNIMSHYLGAFFASTDGSALRFSLFNVFSMESLSSLSYLLVMIVYEIFVVIQVIVQIFFYLLGPLSIVISLFPSFRHVFGIWLANFCAVNFWSVLAAILFRLVDVLVDSPDFQAALQNGEKGVLWDSFILGVIISITLVLIPKFASGIFSRAGASADLGTYGIGITAGVVLSTVWNRLKRSTTMMTHGVTAGTIGGVVGSAQAMANNSPAAATSRNLAEAISNGDAPAAGNWPFRGATQAVQSARDLQG